MRERSADKPAAPTARDDDTDAATVVSNDDWIRVEKTATTDEFAVPAIRYVLESKRDVAVTVDLEDHLPDGFPPERVGFHDDYEGARWRLDGQTVTYERTLDPGERVVTVVGVQVPAPEDLHRFTNEPTVRVEPVGDATDAATDGSVDYDDWPDADDGADTGLAADAPTDATPDDGTADAEAHSDATDDEVQAISLDDPDLDPDDVEDAWADVEPAEPTDLDLADDASEASEDPEATAGDGTDGDAAVADGAVDDGSASDAGASDPSSTEAGPGTDDATDTDDGTDGTETPGVDPDEGDVAAALVAELREDAVDEEDRKRLRQELNIRTSEATTAFVDHLTERVERKREQLQTEVDALEESVQALYGTKADGEEIHELERAIDALDEAKADVEAVDALRAAVHDLDDAKAAAARVDDLADDLEALDDRAADVSAVDHLRDALAELDDRTVDEADAADLERTLDATREEKADAVRLDEVADDLAALDDRAASADALDDLEDRAATKATVEELDAALGELRRESATAERVDTLADRLDDVDDRLHERTADLAATTADADRVDEVETGLATLERKSATQDALADVETALEEEYVTSDDISDELDERFRQGTADVVAYAVAAAGLLLAPLVLLLSGPGQVALAIVPFLVGSAALAAWWYRRH